MRISLGELGGYAPDDPAYGLALYDSEGRLRLAVELSGADPSIFFTNQHGAVVLSMGTTGDDPDALIDGPYLAIMNPDGSPAIQVTAQGLEQYRSDPP